LSNIIIEFGIFIKLIRLISLNETYSRVRVGRHLSEMFPTKNGLKKRDALSLLRFNFAVDHAIRRVQVNKDDFQLNGTHHLLVYTDDINILGGSTHTIKNYKEKQALVVASKKTELELNSDKTNYMIVCQDQNAG